MKKMQDGESVLRIENLFVNQIVFKNSGKNKDTKSSIKQDGFSPQIGFGMQHSNIENNSFKITLAIKVELKDTYILEFSLTGAFGITGDVNNKSNYLKKNAIAIMFPYLRTQLMLLTSQPGLTTVTLPVMNINNLFKEEFE